MKEENMHMKETIQQKINLIEKLKKKIDESQNYQLFDILKKEIDELKFLMKAFKASLQSKRVIYLQKSENKKKYFLEDGSTFVIGSNCKYLYDTSDNSMTYEFSNGQIEKTFKSGIKEIRYPNGAIAIKYEDKTYEIVKE